MNHSRLLSVVCALMLVSTAFVAPVAANPVTDLFSTDDDDEDGFWLERAKTLVEVLPSGAAGVYERAKYEATAFWGDETDASEHADDVQTYFNANNESFLSYVNARATADTEMDVIELTFEGDDSEETVYLVADVNETSDSYESAEILTSDEFDSTGRTVDETVTLEDYAAANAREELEYFDEQYVSEDKDIDAAYLSRLASKYKGDVDASFEW